MGLTLALYEGWVDNPIAEDFNMTTVNYNDTDTTTIATTTTTTTRKATTTTGNGTDEDDLLTGKQSKIEAKYVIYKLTLIRLSAIIFFVSGLLSSSNFGLHSMLKTNMTFIVLYPNGTTLLWDQAWAPMTVIQERARLAGIKH